VLKNILYVLLAVSFIVFGFTLGRFTDVGNVGGKTFARGKMVPNMDDLNSKEKQLSKAIIKKSTDMAKTVYKALGPTGEDEAKFSKFSEAFEKDPVKGLSYFNRPQGQQKEDEDAGKIWKVETGDVPTKGPANAPITIVEFSDFQCPFCQRGYKTMKELEEKYPGKIKHLYASKILPFHKKAPMAHAAAYAAKEQGKFWEFHDMAFENQNQLGDEQYLEWAKKLGLNLNKFKKDMVLEKYQPEFDRMDKLANDLGVRGTPTFFVNGIKLRGAKPTGDFVTVIDQLLAGKSPEETAKSLSKPPDEAAKPAK
jgi:protein-disulfide isomerase